MSEAYDEKTSVIAFIPARGGSQRVYGKNLQVVHGLSLVARAIMEAKARGLYVIVSTDDDAIEAHSFASGADDVHRRVADGDMTVLGVASLAAKEGMFPSGCNHVVVWQPTVTNAGRLMDLTLGWSGEQIAVLPALDRIEERFNGGIDVGYVVIAETHARYDSMGHRLYRLPRVNDNGPVTYRETGLCVVTMDWLNNGDSGREPNHALIISQLADHETIDIDWPSDLAAARHASMRRQSIAFVMLSGRGYGIGHKRRVEALAAELQEHDLHIYTVSEAGSIPDFGDNQYDTIVLDNLPDHIPMIPGKRVVAFETNERRSGATVINELLVGCAIAENDVFSGPDFAVIPLEMRGLPTKTVGERNASTARICVTFGGQDVSSLMVPCVRAIRAQMPDALIRAIIGPEQHPPPETFASAIDENLVWVRDANMLSELRNADIVVSSAGRTVHESWACGTPTIIIPCNTREQTHAFQLSRYSMREDTIEAAVQAVKRSYHNDRTEWWAKAAERLPALVNGGTERVVKLILGDKR